MYHAGRCVNQVCWARQVCMLRDVKIECAILVLPVDDDLCDQMTPIASAGPATVYTCIQVIEASHAFPLV